jgi:hypothetical protein
VSNPPGPDHDQAPARCLLAGQWFFRSSGGGEQNNSPILRNPANNNHPVITVPYDFHRTKREGSFSFHFFVAATKLTNCAPNYIKSIIPFLLP